jgi:uncharacterized protein (TIGR02117 family)
MIRKIVRWLFWIVAGCSLFVISYFIIAFSLSAISVNSEFKEAENNPIDIYLLSNGVHCDVVVPFENQYMKWSKYVSPLDTKSENIPYENVAFGWGDKGFYLETKTWAELKASTAVEALFWMSTSAMHVTFYPGLNESELCKKISIDKDAYLKLTNFIINSFQKDSLGKGKHIVGASYASNDAFYDAVGTYNLFFTCNTWTNNAIKEAGLKACLWTPFDGSIIDKYSK